MADDSGPPRRLTRQWRIKARFAAARPLGAALGLLLAAGAVAASVAGLPDPRAALGGGFLLQAVVLLAAGIGLPWVVIGAIAGWADRRQW